MSSRIFLTLAVLTAACPAMSQTSSTTQAPSIPPAIDLMQTVADSFDTDGDGKISEAEFAEFSRSVWFSRDINNDQSISEQEFQAWDFGFDHIAATKDKALDFAQVKSDLFSYWDADGDNAITSTEAEATAKAEFANADTDRDGFVSGRDLAFGSTSFNAAIFAMRR